MNSNYQNMCKKYYLTSEESLIPTLSELVDLINKATKEMWSWRFGDSDEDPLSFIHRLNEFSSKLTLKSTTTLEEVFLNFHISQKYEETWNYKTLQWDPSPEEIKSLFSKYKKNQ